MNTEMAGEWRIRRQSLHDVVVDRLRDLIVEGVLPPGQRLNERVLSEQLGVSRTPLRESFKVLAVEGLIALLPNRGATVTPLTIGDLNVDPPRRPRPDGLARAPARPAAAAPAVEPGHGNPGHGRASRPTEPDQPRCGEAVSRPVV
jgi:DNA-binding transcriptional MocR family regulator